MAISAEERVLVDTWLRQHGALYVLQYVSHSGGAPDAYLVSNNKDISDLLDRSPIDTELLVFNVRPFPIRGVVDRTLIQRVSAEFVPGEWWQLVNPDYFPAKITHFCTTDNVEEMLTALPEHAGCIRWVGPVPRWDAEWLKANPNGWTSIERNEPGGS